MDEKEFQKMVEEMSHNNDMLHTQGSRDWGVIANIAFIICIMMVIAMLVFQVLGWFGVIAVVVGLFLMILIAAS